MSDIALNERCPNGHPANGAPCVSYKCERRQPLPADTGRCELCGERELCLKCGGSQDG